MTKKLLSLKLDVIFKIYFTRNPVLLKHFVAAILDIPIQEIRSLNYLNAELAPERPEGKEVRLDLNLELNDQNVNIEIQVKKYPDFQARALYYWAKLFTRMLKSGDKYCMLKPAITVSIVDYTLFEDREAWQADITTMFQDTREIFTDKMQLRFLELPKYAKMYSNSSLPRFHSKKEQWLYLFNAGTEQELQHLKETGDEEMKDACEKLIELSQDNAMWELEWTREKELHDFASAIGAAREEGEKIGLDKGEKIGLDKGEKIGLDKGEKIGLDKGKKIGTGNENARICARLSRLGYSQEQILYMTGPDEEMKK